MKIINKILGIIMMLMIVNISTVNASELPFGMMSQDSTSGGLASQVPVAPQVTIDKATDYVKERGSMIIVFLQNIAKPVTLVVMVICGLMAIFSGLTGGRDGGSSKWIISALVAGLCYVGVMGAPMILEALISLFG